MYFDDQNNPNTEPMSGAAPEGTENSGKFPFRRSTDPASQDTEPLNTGEYHFNRDTNPGENSFNARQESYQAPQSDYRPHQESYQNAQNDYQSRQRSYQAPNYQNGGYQGYQNSFDRNAYGASYEQQGYQTPKKPKRAKKSGMGAGIVALSLVCALVGGIVGGGAVYAATSKGVFTGGKATIAVTDRVGGVTTETTTVKAGDPMTPAQIYSTYGSAVVSVSVTTSKGEGAGTGFIVDGKEGYLFTCYHVIDGAQAISVTLTDTTSFPATYVGGDETQDVAILKIKPEEGQTLDLNQMVLGNSAQLAVGDEVCAIGNALGTLANTLTSGHVSALDRAISMSDGTVMNLLQTDTTINSGNSGGPLFNEYGEVIGIVNAKYSSSAYDSNASIEGIGFAIPINDMKDIMDDLMEHGYITGKPYLGISVATVSAVAAQQYSDMVVGAYVSSVTAGSCAEKAGLQVSDIITQVDGEDITTSAELIDAKNRHRAGDEMLLTVYRNKDYITLKVTLDEEKPSEGPIDDGSSQSQSHGSGNGQNGSDYGYSFPFGYGNRGGNAFGFNFPFW